MELTARQLACKAIHSDKENVRNPSIMAKYMREHTNSKLNKIIGELEKKTDKFHDNYEFGYSKGLKRAIDIIKKEITKT